MADIALLETELTDDPLARGYAGMTNQAAADDLNLRIYDGRADSGTLFTYLAKETSKDDATEPFASHILGRMYRVDGAGAAGIGTPTFGAGSPPFSELSAEGLDACRTLLQIALNDRLNAVSEVMTEAKFIALLDRVKDTGVMKPSDVTAIQLLSQNKQTRGEVIGFNFVGEGDVWDVRNG